MNQCIAMVSAVLLGTGSTAVGQSIETEVTDTEDRSAASDLSLNIDRAASWKVRATASVWFPSLRGEQTLGGGSKFDIDIIDQPDVQVAPRYELAFRRDKWTVLTSGFVFNMDENAAATESFIASGTTINAGDRVSYDIDYWSADLFLAYRFADMPIDNAGGRGAPPSPFSVPRDGVGLFFDVLAGARVWHLDYTMNQIGGPSLIDEQETWIDPVVGGRMLLDLPHGFGVEVRGDVGGFGVGSEFAWNIGVAFRAELAENIGAEIGFRHLQTRYESGSGADLFEWDVASAGLYGSIVFRF